MRALHRNIPAPPTPAAQTVLWANYMQTRSIAARNAIVEAWLSLAMYIAERFHAKLPKSVLLEDIFSSATIGLMQAVEAFDPARQVPFKPYASQRIRGAILDDIRLNDWVPRAARRDAIRVEKARATLLHEFGREASFEELSEYLCETPEDVYRMEWLVSSDTSSMVERDDDSCTQPVQRCEPDPGYAASRRLDAEHLLSRVEGRRRQILTLRFKEHLTLVEVSERLGISQGRVCQLQADALRIIRVAHVESDRLEAA